MSPHHRDVDQALSPDAETRSIGREVALAAVFFGGGVAAIPLLLRYTGAWWVVSLVGMFVAMTALLGRWKWLALMWLLGCLAFWAYVLIQVSDDL